MQTYLELKRAAGDRDKWTEIIRMLHDQHGAGMMMMILTKADETKCRGKTPPLPTTVLARQCRNYSAVQQNSSVTEKQ